LAVLNLPTAKDVSTLLKNVGVGLDKEVLINMYNQATSAKGVPLIINVSADIKNRFRKGFSTECLKPEDFGQTVKKSGIQANFNNIQGRDKANDVVYTPPEVVDLHLTLCIRLFQELQIIDGIILEPSRGYYYYYYTVSNLRRFVRIHL